jgi:hypothetical protein
LIVPEKIGSRVIDVDKMPQCGFDEMLPGRDASQPACCPPSNPSLPRRPEMWRIFHEFNRSPKRANIGHEAASGFL